MNNWSTWERPKFRVYQTVKLPFIVSLQLMRVSAMFESVCGWSELPLSFRTTVRRVVHAASTPLTHKTSRDCCQLVPMFVIFTLACHQRLIISTTRPHCHRPTDTTLRNLCLPLETSDRIFAASADLKIFKKFQSAADRRTNVRFQLKLLIVGTDRWLLLECGSRAASAWVKLSVGCQLLGFIGCQWTESLIGRFICVRVGSFE